MAQAIFQNPFVPLFYGCLGGDLQVENKAPEQPGLRALVALLISIRLLQLYQ